jgi:hypothetical protein
VQAGKQDENIGLEKFIFFVLLSSVGQVRNAETIASLTSR